ncbi:MAG: hypothetical protein CMJ20_01020 [Phycisphaeraceae bacterium]|nr:hypothetical protein [Phycisphaeraceae bacterium]
MLSVNFSRITMAIFCCGMMACELAVAQARPLHTSRDRCVKWFDFEERERNPNELPEHWFAVGRQAKISNPSFSQYSLHRHLMAKAGFPRYTQVQFDQSHSWSGGNSFYLGLNGGSAGAFLEVGAIDVVGNSDYLIFAHVRTTQLSSARAQLKAYFIDMDGNKIEASESITHPVATDGAWQRVAAKLFGEFPQAVWIGLELELNQPEYNPDDPLGRQQTVLEQVQGGAWFDDIVIWQSPRLVIQSPSPVNIVRAPEQPRLTVQVVDLLGQRLVADLGIYDYRLNRVAYQRQTVGPGAPSVWEWRPPLDRYGWYLVDMQVHAPRAKMAKTPEVSPVLRVLSGLLYLPDEVTLDVPDATRFMLAAEDLPDEQLVLVPQLMDAARINSVALSAWQRDTSLIQATKRRLATDESIDEIISQHRQVTLDLFPVPNALTQLLDITGSNPMAIFDSPIRKWRPYLAPLMMRHANRIRSWKIGASQSEQAFYNPALPSLVESSRVHLAAMAPNPKIVVPWNLNQSRIFEISDQAAYAVRVPDSVVPQQLGAYLEEWLGGPPAEVSLLLDVPTAMEMSHERRVDDLILRMIHAWEAGAVGMQLRRPWAVSSNREISLVPDPLLGVFATVAHRLAGRRVLGRLSFGDGLEAMILDGKSGGMLIAWNESGLVAETEIELYLGDNPVVMDHWGNRTPARAHAGRHQIRLTKTPIFIEGIDPELAMFRSLFRVDSDFIESKQQVHHRTVSLSNPWPHTMTGQIILTDPQQWVIQPRRTVFSILPGGTQEIPISLRFPASEVSGHKQLTARVEFVTTRKYVVDVSNVVELGLRDVKLDTNLSLESDESTGMVDLFVNLLVVNKGAEILNLRSFVIVQGRPRQVQPISGLHPGQSIIRQFRFGDVSESIDLATIRVGLRELAGPAVLNQILTTHNL